MPTSRSSPPSSLPLDILQAAAEWHVQLNDETASDKHRRAWQAWLQSDERHHLAWGKMQALQRELDRIPDGVAVPVLGSVHRRKRRSVGTLLLLLGAGGLGLASYQAGSRNDWLAGYRTHAGERRRITLADGGELHINTGSALDVDYQPSLRQVRLYRGEIMIRTSHDSAGRPFVVDTAQGRIRALGTRFQVRIDGDRVLVGVAEGMVEITPANSPASVLRLPAGNQTVFSSIGADAPRRLSPYASAWVDGRLVATEMRLGDFIAELARYRPGYLSCDPDIAGLRVSGVFRLSDTDDVLSNLTVLLPIRIFYATRYWVRVGAI